MQPLKELDFLLYHVIITQIFYFCKAFCPTYLRAPYMDNRLYMSYNAMLTTSHMGECIQACSYDAVCVSFFFNHGTRQCALVGYTLSNSTDTEDRKGWLYYQCFISEYNSSTMFFYGSGYVTWETAKLMCKERNAFLAEPKNEDLSNFLILWANKMTRKIGGSCYWTGGYYTPDESIWRWNRFNTTFSYTNWYGSSGAVSNIACVCLPYQDKWLPDSCGSKRRYICQRETV